MLKKRKKPEGNTDIHEERSCVGGQNNQSSSPGPEKRYSNKKPEPENENYYIGNYLQRHDHRI